MDIDGLTSAADKNNNGRANSPAISTRANSPVLSTRAASPTQIPESDDETNKNKRINKLGTKNKAKAKKKKPTPTTTTTIDMGGKKSGRKSVGNQQVIRLRKETSRK